VPASGVDAVAINVTVTNPTLPSYLTVWPTGTPQPTAANLNFVPGQTVPNMIIAKVGANGRISIFNFHGSTDVIVDVLGWFPAGAGYTGLSPARLMDSRSDTRVVNVVDGDTVDLDNGARVRLIGIDAPEVGSCEADTATEALRALVLGRTVALTTGGDGDDVDHYGRLLRYVDVGGVDAGLTLIQGGLAIARYDSRDGYGRHDREEAYLVADFVSAAYVCSPQPPGPPGNPSPPAPPADVYYENCDAARAAGAAPIYAGEPGYREGLDRDGDGIACE
jgi:endonuclease YncB( thermonuclease family)